MARLATKASLNESGTHSLTRKFCKMWGIEDIADNIQVEFSSRITRSLGRTQPVAKIVRLNPKLQACSQGLFKEVLCHELAHIAAYCKFGSSIRPHGPEWQSLVLAAGYEPLVRLPVQLGQTTKQSTNRYIHKCPVCQSVRIAKKPMKRWRCGECFANGLTGRLTIKEAE